jgi:HSP20 family protein
LEDNDMTEAQDIATKEAQELENAIRPAVDIYEDDTGITLLADMPGVSRERLDVHVDRDSLSIEGRSDIDMPQEMEALYADIHSTRYQRSFSLSRELDGDNIQANLKDGVLTVHIPKRAERKPRKVEVHTD